MKKIIKKIFRYLLIPFILLDYFKFKKNNKRFVLRVSDFYPCVKDKTVKTGFDRHYIYHTAWAARKVREINPAVHFDIASSLYFSAIVSAFVPIKFFDYRPADINLQNLESLQADLLALPFADSSVINLSCMHVIEHVGLGRYGDKINPDGDIKAINELKRVLASKGNLLFVVPVGKKALIQFNAHRIYTYDMIKEMFSDLILKEFCLIPENNGKMVYDEEAVNKTKEENYACGCFWFQKK